MSAMRATVSAPADELTPTLTGDELRELRLRVNLSQSELARRLGYSRSAICRWERAGHRASIPAAHVNLVLDTLLAARQQQEAWRQQLNELTRLLLGGGESGRAGT